MPSLPHFLRMPCSGTAAPRPRVRRKEARPGELLDAALDLFVDKGYAATRVEEVAQRAGVSKGTLFLYFPSKLELFKAVVRQNIAGFLGQWRDELRSFEGDTPAMLRHGLLAWWDNVGSQKAAGITKVMFCEAHNFPEIAEFYRNEVVEPAQALLRDILECGMARGEFRRLDSEYAVQVIVAPLLHLVMMRHATQVCIADPSRFAPERYMATMIDCLVDGLRAPPAELRPTPPAL